MNISFDLEKTTVCTQEYYGEEDCFVIFHYKIDVNGYEYEIKSHTQLEDISEEKCINHIAEKICTKKEYLSKAFDSMKYEEDECFMPVCEDDFLMGELTDIRELIDEDETYVYGRDFNFTMTQFVEKHFDEKLIDILVGEI